MVLSMLNSKKDVRSQQYTDGATIVLRKYYHTGLNKIRYSCCQHVLSIKTTTIIFNLSVLIFLNFNKIPSVKVSGNSNRQPEMKKDTINTLRLYTTWKY